MAAAVVLASCGAAGSAGGAPSPPPPRTYHIGNGDAGRTLRIRVGDAVVAFFYANPDQAALGEITSSNPAVLAPRVDTAATVVRGGRLAKLQGVAPGRADISVTRAPLCKAGAACPAFVMLISVHVVVIR